MNKRHVMRSFSKVVYESNNIEFALDKMMEKANWHSQAGDSIIDHHHQVTYTGGDEFIVTLTVVYELTD